MMQSKRLLTMLCLLVSAAVPGYSSTAAYTNPLKGNIGTHDPVMIKQDKTWYVFYTGDYIPIKTSTDRITWKESGTVFNPCPAWFKQYVPANDGKNCWAPDISFRDSTYWLYYSVSTFGKRVSAIGLATTPALNPADPRYKWTDEGMILTSTDKNNYNCIDPNLFADEDGKIWLNFGSWNTGIKMVEINPETGKTATASPTIHSLARRQNTGTGIEAPFIIKRAGYYYLFVSWDNCCKGVQSTYNIRVGRASKVTGPYNDKSNVAMNSGGGTLIDKGDERWIGPGHNGIFTEHDTVFLVNHAYDANDNGASKLMIRPLFWDTAGWPSLDPAKGAPTATEATVRPQLASATFIRNKTVVVDLKSVYMRCDRRIYSITGRQIAPSNDRFAAPGVYIVVPVNLQPVQFKPKFRS